ncbi:hypothetical protein MIMGU_mgv1a011785mg [Erythranthe guttata]|uniref:Angiotensin-converting enzyme 2 n=1 Tax=Erythranthe guttata TaxID=4155 RepID=A0A022PWP6_ERYGU|nr:PREDICTED: uncharacterized protein LOC105976676 isoform X2 [Erythranthe guttata]EYU20797.1 hypothetical protein MIMGU_mgv1a011785mg [Erythranthe guttata]|eukprot:XP_012857387.1 PREDICTED: uncharacterized protein LOC105976676 isoform X2 [Erythranthe guttata]
MSNGEVRRKVSRQDIQLVQNLIERCLQLYMSEREVVSTLLQQAEIEPGFTELVWQKLETENQEFFRAYHLRLLVKDQILRFNQLLEKQVDLIHQVCQSGVASVSLSNGSQIHSSDSPFMFGGNVMGEEASVSHFNGGESSSQPLNENIFDPEMNSFGFVGQMPRNFSLSDLTADFSNSTDIESYMRSPYRGTDANFLDPHIRVEQDIRRMDTISERLSYEDFGSD